MAARAALHTLLTTDEGLQTLGVEETYPANTIDTPPEDCFLVTKWGRSEVAFKNVGPVNLEIWVHDRQHDYGRINDILNYLRELIPAQIHLPGDDNYMLNQARWLAESEDLYDGGYETRTRFAEFEAVTGYHSPVDP